MTSQMPVKAVTAGTRDAVPSGETSRPVLLECGLNWVSFVASHPFEVTGMTLVRVSDENEEDSVPKKCDVRVQSQLPVQSVMTSSVALTRVFTYSTVHPSARAEMTREVQHIGTVWCLHPSSIYMATLSSSAEENECTSTSTTVLKVQTRRWTSTLDLRAVALHVLDRGSLLFHPEFSRCILSQGSGHFMFYLPPNLLDPTTALPFIREMWYNGLFSLPELICVGGQHTAMFFVLPNGERRYTLDLAPELTTTPAASSTRQLDTQVLDTPASLEAPATLYSWRCHKKVRRIINSSAYAVVVRDDPSGVEESLQRAYSYHRQKKESTWLNDAFIRLMGQCSSLGLSSTTDAADSQATEAGKTHKVRLLCIELVEKATGEVMAGSCGMAVGRAYHDYTMYTLRRSREGLGTFLTKLIGEALQRCGYTLWYWGFCVEYMQEYERCLGAVDMPRDVFHRRWCAARDAVPEWTIDAYLRSHKGMVPYYERTSSSAKHQVLTA
ncbi:hypothetical protein JKF63_03045 [Porcisia hertigi]|uniref:Uncharacterized protein n=1 Tax=Porcisia hertigi TaxID=2761500 RepID=A0A836L6C0_9TRYP|nr:hypothetical protein JKF63_03045 [Porcisia hertigi]